MYIFNEQSKVGSLTLFAFVLQVLKQTFPQHTFLMNGLIHGVKVIHRLTRICLASRCIITYILVDKRWHMQSAKTHSHMLTYFFMMHTFDLKSIAVSKAK